MSQFTGMRRRAAALGLVITGCTASEKPAAGSDATLVAYTGQSGDYQINFNPFSPSRIGGLGTIYEPLFFFNKAKVSDPVPLLGTQQSWNADGTVLSVTLRDKVAWSDGQPFTAKDVAFTFDLLKNNAAINNTGYDGTVAVVDDTHVTFTFKAPAFVKSPDVLGVPIVPEHLWKTINPTQDVVEKPVGSGAYLLKEYKPQAFTYEANPGYWGGQPKVKKIRFVALSGNQAGADGIAAGTIDWLTGPIPDIQNTQSEFGTRSRSATAVLWSRATARKTTPSSAGAGDRRPGPRRSLSRVSSTSRSAACRAGPRHRGSPRCASTTTSEAWGLSIRPTMC